MFRGRPKRFYLKLLDDDAEPEEAEKEKEESANLKARQELIVDFGCETPRINYDFYDGKEYKFFYAISSDVDLDHPGWVKLFHITDI